MINKGPSSVEELKASIEKTRQEIALAGKEIADAREAAIEAAIRLRDLSYAESARLIASDDAELVEVRSRAERTRAGLERERARLRSAEARLVSLGKALEERQAEREAERRSRFVRKNHPELAESLDQAEAAYQEALSEPDRRYRGSSLHQKQVLVARENLHRAREAFDQAATQAPA